jgi:GTP cyclohydrolase I
MEKHIKAILQALGEDTEREGLKNTPLRVSQSLRYLTSGSRESLDDILNSCDIALKRAQDNFQLETFIDYKNKNGELIKYEMRWKKIEKQTDCPGN